MKKKKNIKQRYWFSKLEKKRIIYKILSKNQYFNPDLQCKIRQNLFFFPKITSITNIKNLCVLTGRSRSIYRFLKISRIKFRELASNGKLSGISKYSW